MRRDVARADELDFNAPEVLLLRNRMIAESVGIRIGLGPASIRSLHEKVEALASDPRKLVEHLYEKLWVSRPGISRDAVQAIINACHGEAVDRLLQPEEDGETGQRRAAS